MDFIVMKFDQLLAIVADEPVFETGLLLAGSVNLEREEDAALLNMETALQLLGG